MPTGIPKQQQKEFEGCLGFVFSLQFVSYGLASLVLILFINGAVWLSKTGVIPIVSTWNFLESIWSWLPLIILGVLLITLLILCMISEHALLWVVIPSFILFLILLGYLIISGAIIMFTEEFFWLD